MTTRLLRLSLPPQRETVAIVVSPDRPVDTSEVDNGDCSTTIRYGLLRRWLQVANDPALSIAEWLSLGAPAGIECGFDDLDGIFPRVAKDDDEFDPAELSTDPDTFVNYTGVESDPAVDSVIKGYVTEGYLKPFHSLDEVRRFVNGDPVLTKVGAVTKDTGKTDPDTGEKIIKIRNIVDSKQSGVSKLAKRTHKSNLPLATRTIRGLLGMHTQTHAHRHAH